MSASSWQSYEDVARHILGKFREHFDLDHVEPKQPVAGESGTEWEIDAKGVKAGGAAFVIVECRCRNAKQNQESLGGLAFRIIDSGAAGGIIVSPMNLQEGAAKVARAAGIVPVKLNANATPHDFCVQFFDKGFAEVSDTLGVAITESASIVKRDANGRLVIG